MNFNWLRTVVLAVLAFVLLIVYAAAYRTMLINPPRELLRSQFSSMILVAFNLLPFIPGLMLGLAAYNGPIRGLKFSVLNLIVIAALPMIFGCLLPFIAALGRLLGPEVGTLIVRSRVLTLPAVRVLQPLLVLAAGFGLGVAFIRGFKEPEPSPVESASPPPAEA